MVAIAIATPCRQGSWQDLVAGAFGGRAYQRPGGHQLGRRGYPPPLVAMPILEQRGRARRSRVPREGRWRQS